MPHPTTVFHNKQIRSYKLTQDHGLRIKRMRCTAINREKGLPLRPTGRDHNLDLQ